jgi:phosphatidylserine/phosphatidylglycerophosphate/cardiolipin synthase-like enzyme
MIRILLPLLLLALSAIAAEPPEFQLVETWPIETQGLDQPDLPDAHLEWIDMIELAQLEICVASFYLSDDPDDDSDRLDQVLKALAAAGARGVRVQILTDKGFDRTYPELSAHFSTLPGCETRLLDARTLWGGVLHAKYMVVDGRECYVGSQNWDWRALTHIRELGVRLRHPELSGALQQVFALDWALAGNEEPPVSAASTPGPFELTTNDLGAVNVTMAASPEKALPSGMGHDLAPLEAMINAASQTLVLQLLSYHPSSRDGSEYLELDTALRRAAARGVEVRMIVSNWAKRKSQLPWLKSLACVPGLEVRFTNIPEWSGGFVPFGRVEHPKYLVADGRQAWISTSNWGPGYFSDSRNISLFVEGDGIAGQLLRFFDAGWNGPYAEILDPGRDDYEAPRRQE